MDPIFLNDWSPEYIKENSYGDEENTPLKQLMYDFAITEETMKGVNIILASYTYRDYEGDAFVLFIKEGKIYEVNGSHCSCYGLEEQWEPEEINIEELKNRIFTHYCFEGCQHELQKLIIETEINELIKQYTKK